MLGLCWTAVCSAAAIPWNAPRLAPSFALAHGLPIHALRSSGAQLGWIYGPVMPCWFLPATLFKNLTVAFMFAGAWNVLTLLAPVYLALRVALDGRRGAVVWIGTLAGGILLFANPLTQYSFYLIHVDALCIAWGVVAAAALHAAAVRRWSPGLPLAALAVALAIWTKQIAIMLVPAFVCWLWREGFGRLAARWLWWLAICGGGLTLVIFLLFGLEELLFNVVVFHTHNPWADDATRFGPRLWTLLSAGGVWWMALVIGWFFWRAAAASLSPATGSWVRLLLWIAVWQAPLGLIAASKAGGAFNSLHALNYLLLAGLAAGTEAVVRWRDARGSIPGRALLWGATFAVGGVVAGGRLAIERGVAWRPDHRQEEQLSLALQQPGKVYFPWNPLVTILSDHRIYPFDDALLSLWRAGLEPPPSAIRDAVPPGAVIVYDERAQSRFALRYFGKKRNPDPAATSP